MPRPQPYPGFIGPAYRSQSSIAAADVCMNWYPEVIESETAKSRFALYPTPGLTEFATIGFSPNRATFSEDGRAFRVVGAAFVETFDDGSETQHGTIDSDSFSATICSSGTELFITSARKGYIFTLATDTLSAAIGGLDADVGGYLDGFFIALNAVDSEIRISEFRDGLTWDPTQFRTRAAASDKWVSMIVAHNEIWLFGTKTYEVWFNAGTSPFPFNQIPNILFSQGTLARFSPAKVGESVIWLSRNEQGPAMVMLAQQYAPVRVSNHGVEYALGSYLRAGFDLSDAVSMVYQEDGHTFCAFTFTDADKTWVYDVTTNAWHERGYWNTTGDTAMFNAWRPMYHMSEFGFHLVGDRASGKLYKMQNDVYTDVTGAGIRRVRRAPHLNANGDNIRYHRLEIDVETGVGKVSGQGSNPLLMMRRSNDGGKTWGNEKTRTIGAIGEYLTTVAWNRLGKSADRVFEISASDPVPFRLINAYLKATVD